MSEIPLDGVRVLDLTSYVAGPFCTKLLADWGCEVIKIERPSAGDGARRMGPFPGDIPDMEASGTFLYLNTNKKSVTLDLTTPTGVGIFQRLAKDVDIVVEGLRPGTMERWGLSHEDLKAVNPTLVMTSISNFGQTGPYRDFKGTDLTLSALGGMTSQQRYEHGAPFRQGGLQSMYKAGITSFVGTMGALLHRTFSGEGQHLDISIHEAAASGDVGAYAMFAYTGASYTGKSLAGLHGHPATFYSCKDGYIWVATGLGNIENLALIMGQPELMENPKFSDRYARQERPKDFDALVQPWLDQHSKKEIQELAQEIRMPFGAVLTIDEVLQDEHLHERGFFVSIDHPRTGPLTYPGTSVKMTNGRVRTGRAPCLGEHNAEILGARLGLTNQELSRLRASAII